MTSSAAWQAFASNFNALTKSGVAITGENMRVRFGRYKKKYHDAKRLFSGTGSGLTEKEISKGITIAQKLNKLCYSFDRMDALFGHSPSSEPLVTASFNQGEGLIFTQKDFESVLQFTSKKDVAIRRQVGEGCEEEEEEDDDDEEEEEEEEEDEEEEEEEEEDEPLQRNRSSKDPNTINQLSQGVLTPLLKRASDTQQSIDDRKTKFTNVRNRPPSFAQSQSTTKTSSSTKKDKGRVEDLLESMQTAIGM